MKKINNIKTLDSGSLINNIKPRSLIISSSFVLLLLVPVLFIKPDLLLMERFFPGFAWIEILVLTIYAGWLSQVMINAKSISNIRTKYWFFFSVVFFSQFVLGLFVNDRFLMTGELHLPIPALILAAPVFRGEGFFMPILLISTLALGGPAWCSSFCYIGSWDNLASLKRRPKKVSRKQTIIIRYLMVLLVIVAALILRYSGASISVVIFFALFFALLGVFIMLYFSRKMGYMLHCTTYCPIGGIVTLLGKLYPVRMKIDQNTCTSCNICTTECKYDALSSQDIKAGKAGWNCTLCGDCITSCHASSISFSFFGMKKNAWETYMAIIVGTHAAFLALARL